VNKNSSSERCAPALKKIVACTSLAVLSGIASGAALAAITVEAENMSRSNYSLDGSYIKVTSSSSPGTATKAFSGTSGKYDVQVYVRGETDGTPTVELYKGSTLLGNYTYSKTDTTQSFKVSGVSLAKGETIKLVGRPNAGALARIDKVVYTAVPTTTTTTTTSPTTTTTTSPTTTPTTSPTTTTTSPTTTSTTSTTTASGTPITVQAEGMTRSNYALDGSLIKLSTSTSGTATAPFSGPTGTYRVQVYVQPENDGQPTLELYKGSTLLKKFVYPLSTTATSFVIDNVAINNGESMKLLGTANAGALARVDKVVYTPVTTTTTSPTTTTTSPTTTTTTTPTTTTTSPTTTTTATVVTMQAEGMTRTNYALDGSLIKISTGTTGTATATFAGVTGTYKVDVYVQPENDGTPTVELFKNGTTLKRYTYPLSTAATSFSVDNVSLNTGDTVKLVGTIQGGALARVDKIVFTPVAAAPTTTTTAPTTTTTTPTTTTTTPPASTATALPVAGKAVPTFESIGLYWTPPANPGAAGCGVQFRKAGETSWSQGLDMWFDSRNSECRGSLVHLTPGTSYEVKFNMPGKPAEAQLTAKTWAEQFPVAKIITVTSGNQPLNITEGGTADGYVVYTGAPGTTLDVANAATHNITVSAPYVIIRGLTLKGAKQDAIRLNAGARDVVIEDNDISEWGRFNYTNSAGWNIGVDGDSGVRCVSQLGVERIVIQRNKIHHPRYGANSWSWGHPAGPQGVTMNYCGGHHVIRHNDIYSEAKRYFNDGIGGGDNFTDKGFPNYDSDIYGNKISQVWDDAIEAEGGNRNVRIWGNYFDQTALGVATTVAHHGPVYIWRNVYNRSRKNSESAPDSDDRNAFAKAGTGRGYGNGRRYVFHNTLLQAPPVAGATLTSGAGVGLVGPSSTETLTNTVSRNNIWHIWKPHWASIDEQGGTGNDVDYDLFNGQIRTTRGTEVNGLVGTPIYQAGHGWVSESNGLYQLAPTSPGYDKGVKLPNFNDGFAGTAPDMGAHEAGSVAMKFGVGAGTKAY
jgi:hypothetical protein